MGKPEVVAVHRSSSHSFSKFPEDSITLVEGLGVAGDAHAGKTVKHRSRVVRDASQPNLRQVHLLEVTGLRNPCSQIDRFQQGLMAAVLDRDGEGQLVRKAGVMGVVVSGGPIGPGDQIDIQAVVAYSPLVPV